MIRFEYTDNHVYTCRDCDKCGQCRFTKYGKEPNRLLCIDASIIKRRQKITVASWDYMQLKRQLTIMKCNIETTKNNMLREELLPKSLKSKILGPEHSFTEFCAFKQALDSYYNFLIENEQYGDNDEFIDDMINSVIILGDGKISIESENKKLKQWIKKDVTENGYIYEDT